jgi:hypothetical protein
MNFKSEHEERIAKFPEPIRNAHTHSSDHRRELLASAVCGCFYCQAIYPPVEITEWVDEDDAGQGQTALCAKCGIDSVIGDKSGFPVTREFLAEMNRCWF